MQNLNTINVESAPDRFRIFKKGLNETTKGAFNFDDAAADRIMDFYTRRNVDVMIDLEHLSLDKESNAYNPDAMGWAKLAVIDSELWAVDVRWTEEGRSRIETKKQRYISPVIVFEDDNREQMSLIVNLALCANPATFGAYPLIAASYDLKGDKMDLEVIANLLGLPEDADIETILEAIRALMSKVAETATEETTEGAETATEETAEETSEDEVSALSAIAKLTAENAALKMEIDSLKKSNLIRSNPDKIPPALEGWAATLSLSALEGFIKTAPRINPSRSPKVEHTNSVALTEGEKLTAKLTGIDPNKIIEYKRKINAAK